MKDTYKDIFHTLQFIYLYPPRKKVVSPSLKYADPIIGDTFFTLSSFLIKKKKQTFQSGQVSSVGWVIQNIDDPFIIDQQ